MGSSGRQRTTPPPQKTTARTEAPPVNTAQLRSDLLGASKAYVKNVANEKRPYFKKAVMNPYNLTLFLGSLAASLLTFSPFLAVIACALEVMWIVFAPESKVLQKTLWDPQIDKERAAEQQQAYIARVATLDNSEQSRVANLVARQLEINRLAEQNPSLSGDLLRTELGKTGRLVEAFIDMAVTCSRYGQYLRAVNLNDLEGERIRWESIIKHGGTDQSEQDIARKNLAIVMKRFDKMKEIQHYLVVARGQLDLIENSFQLISDQIVTMQSPQELSGQLDELLDGVESIKEATTEAESLVNTAGPAGLTSSLKE